MSFLYTLRYTEHFEKLMSSIFGYLRLLFRTLILDTPLS